MSGLILLAGLGLWLVLGVYVLKRLIRRKTWPASARLLAAAGFLALWVLGPFVDEYLGQREFKRLCDETPDVQFTGPVSVGEGPFFDAQGKPKWADRKQFDAIAQEPVGWNANGGRVKRWDQMFPKEQTTYRIANWPVPVLEQRSAFVYAPTGQVLLDSRWRGSPGGWLKRATGWGSHAPYQCGSRKRWPDDIEWITF